MATEEEVTLDAPDASGPDTLGMVGQVAIGRWGRLSWFPFEVFVGFLLIVSGATYVLDPASADVVRAPTIAIVTVGMLYVLAGLGVVIGLWRVWVRAELAGILLLELGFVTWVLMGILYQSGNSLRHAALLVPLTWAAGTRALSILRGRYAVQIERTG